MVALDALTTRAMAGRSKVLSSGILWRGTTQDIIGYGEVVQPRSRGADVECFAVGPAQQKRYLSVYVSAVENGAY